VTLGVGAAVLVAFYAVFTFVRLEVFKMLLSSFFPLAFMILAVLGTIVFGLATPTEAAAVGSFGGLLLAAAYRQLNTTVLRESVFLTAKTSAMVCWLFVGSSIFSAAFALLGGQEVIEQWVMSLGLTKIQFLLLSQVIIFLLGWPLEWTEIIVIFMPIFIPLLDNFGVDPLFFGCWWRSTCRRPPVAAGRDGRLLPEGGGAAARDAEPDLRGHDPVHDDPGAGARAAVPVPRSACGCRRSSTSDKVVRWRRPRA